MQENTKDNVEDRFYKPLGEMSDEDIKNCANKIVSETTNIENKKCSLNDPKEIWSCSYYEHRNHFINKPKAVVHSAYEYAPEPQHMFEAKACGLKFTVGNSYELIEKKKSGIGEKYKLKNDSNQEVWVDEKYFIPANIMLAHDEELGFSMPIIRNDIPLDECDNLYHTDNFFPDTNKPEWQKAFEETTAMLDQVDLRAEKKEFERPSEDELNEFKVLSGFNQEQESESEWDYDSLGWIRGECVEDNCLLEDTAKCQAAIDMVFGKGKKAIDPDRLLSAIQCYLPNLTIAWNCDKLEINGARSKIDYYDIQQAHAGLSKIVSSKTAQKAVAKLIASEVKKLF